MLPYEQSYGIPEGQVFLESELVSIDDSIKPLIENYTVIVRDSLISNFTDILMNGIQKVKIRSIRELIGLSLVTIPFINTLILKNKASAHTIIRSNAFSIGLISGIGFAYWGYSKVAKQSFSRAMVQYFATEGLKFTIKQFPKLNLMIYMMINKAATSILKMPEYKDLLGDFINDSDTLMNPNKLLRMFVVNLLAGLVIGFLVFRYSYKRLLKLSQENSGLLSIVSRTLPGSFRQLAMFSIADDIKSMVNVLKKDSIKPKQSKLKKDISELYQTYILTDVYKLKDKKLRNPKQQNILASYTSKSNKFTSNFKTDDNVIERFEVVTSQGIDYFREAIGPDLFDKYVNGIYLVLSEIDNAFVKLSKASSKKCDIFLVINRNIHKSVWIDFTVKEIAAVLAHEFGHFYGGAFKLLPAVKLSYLSTLVATGLFQDNLLDVLAKSAVAYSTITFAKLAEIQADAFAIKIGLGKELKSSLSKMSANSISIDGFSQLTTHGEMKSRIEGIGKWAKLYPTLIKQSKV